MSDELDRVGGGLRKTFLPRGEFVELGRGMRGVDADRFRNDVDAAIDPYADEPS